MVKKRNSKKMNAKLKKWRNKWEILERELLIKIPHSFFNCVSINE